MIIANPILSGSVNISGSLNVNGESIGATSVSSSLATVAERVRAGSSGSRDSSTPQSGSLWFNTNTGNLEVYNGASGSGWSSVAENSGPSNYNIDYLVVAGGGSGGNVTYPTRTGGGGGAGGLRTSFGSTSGQNSSAESQLIVSPGVAFTITVGGGGAPNQVVGAPGLNGDDSSIEGSGYQTITSSGGGGGGGNDIDGKDGGCGGGGKESNGAGGSGTSGQGYGGGTGSETADRGGAGGGAGAAGTGTDGGNGLGVAITGTNTNYAGGGASTGTAGSGGGGSAGNDGSVNTGGGGGGVNNTYTNGGSGVVILRMPTTSYSGTTTGSPTVTEDGDFTIIKYTQSGTYTS